MPSKQTDVPEVSNNEPFYFMTFIDRPYHEGGRGYYVKRERTFCLRNKPKEFLAIQ